MIRATRACVCLWRYKNFDLVPNLKLALATTELHTMIADIESMGEMAIFSPGNPESHWHDRYGSR
jgi:hypothetical protein